MQFWKLFMDGGSRSSFRISMEWGARQLINYNIILLGIGKLLIKRYGIKTDKSCSLLSQEKNHVGL